MYKTKNILATILGILILSTTTALAAPDSTIQNISKFTPNRPGVQFVEGIQGFTFPTFNNFTSNPNISQGGRQGDERAFLVGKLCPGGVNNCPGQYYRNTIGTSIKEDDVLRFEIYFHNNGNDPYKGVNPKSPNAKNVKVGIDIDNIIDPDKSFMLRPKGFISASNNQYRTNWTDATTVIKDSSGAIVRTATDDMQVLMSKSGLKLELIPGSAWLGIKTGQNTYFDQKVSGKTDITFDTVDPDQVTVSVTPHETETKMWLEFDELPGCFRYSGAAYFDAVVVGPPPEIPKICELLEIELTGSKKYKTETAYKLEIKTLEFEENSQIPQGTKIKWTSDDPEGRFWVGNAESEPGSWADPNFSSQYDPAVIWSFQTVTTDTDDYVYYIGKGPVKAVLTGIDENLANVEICKDSIEIPIPDIICKTLNVDRPEEIMEGTLSAFRATAIDTDNQEFGGKITYSVTPGYGHFFTTKQAGYAENTSPIVNETGIFVPMSANILNFGEISSGQDLMTAIFSNTSEQEDQNTPNSPLIQTVVESVATGSLWGANLPKAPESSSGSNRTPVPVKVSEYGQTSVFYTSNLSGRDFLDEIPTFSEEEIDDIYSSVTVDQGDIVYFYAKKPGINVITAKTVESDEAGCKRKFSIIAAPEKPLTCESATLTATKPNNEELVCMSEENGAVRLEAEFFSPEGEKLDPEKIQVRWTREENGTFIVFNENDLSYSESEGPVIGKTKILYVGSGAVTAELYTLDGELYEGTACVSYIPPCEVEDPICKTINIDHHETIMEETWSSFKSTATNTDGEPFESQITYSVTPGHGHFYTTKPANAKENDSPMIYETTQTPNPMIWNIIDNVITGNLWNSTLPPEKATSTQSLFSKFGKISIFEIPNAQRAYPLIDGLTEEEIDILFSTLTVNQGETVYFLAKKRGTDVITIKTTDSDEAGCERKFSIIPAPDEKLICESIKLTATKRSGEAVQCMSEENGKVELKAEFFSSDGEKLDPAKIQVVWWTNEGNFTYYSNENGTIAEKEGPVFLGGEKALYMGNGAVGAKLYTLDGKPYEGTACITYIPACEEPPEDMICELLNATVTNSSNNAVDALVPGETYLLEATATYSTENQNPAITYSINPTVGFFYGITEENSDIIGTGDGELPPFIGFILGTIVDQIGQQIFGSTVTVPEGEAVYLITLPGLTSSVLNALVIEATGYPNCLTTYDLIVKPPVEEGFECIDLDIVTPSGNWTVDKDDDRQGFRIRVQTLPEGHSDDLWYNWEVSGNVKDGEWTNGNAIHVKKGTLTNTLTWTSKEGNRPKVDVYASYEINGAKIPACSDSIRARFETEEEGEPELLKEVYVKNKYEDADTLINIGSKDNTRFSYLTYVYTFKAGEVPINWVELIDKDFNNSQEIFGDKGGYLSYKGMRINVKEGSKKFTILEEGDYITDGGDSGYTSASRRYENTYSCAPSNSKICLKDNDFEDVAKDFTRGKFIRFENVKENSIIMIKVQVKNNTKINEEYCKNLTTLDGCGEEFNNRAEFETSAGDEGRASARVISVCPYILTRSGGDVFFHDILNTGRDIAYCSPVRSSTGLGITKTPIIPQINISTGPDADDPNIILNLPSHDICNYSNSEKADIIEEYRNPLKNFSSTICELKADVSEAWSEKNIKEAIKANITRIARWGQNMGEINNLSSADQLSGIKTNGVYTKINGDLTIDLNDEKALSGSDTPAAKTFIIQGGDLKIKSNISAKAATNDFQNPKNVPSYAFIVLDGNILIDNNVEEIDGILMAVSMTDLDKGEIKSSEGKATDQILTINGSLFGNVYDLFKYRQGVGDPRKDEGSVTIRYDQRVLLNTPPGLSELINVSTALVP